MKTLLSMIALSVLTVGLTGCELDNNKARNLALDNVSRHQVRVIPLTTEWEGVTLAPGENRTLKGVSNPDFTWEPLDRVMLGASSSARNAIFVDKAPNPDPPIIIITNSASGF